MGAVDNTSSQFRDYHARTGHQPNDEGGPIHDLTQIYPADFYDKPHLYGFNPDYDKESLSVIKKVRGNPHAPVTIYRAVPHGVTEINPGDWVTPSRSYAQHHGRHYEDPSQDLPVISKVVPAHELLSPADDLNEYGWFPKDK